MLMFSLQHWKLFIKSKVFHWCSLGIFLKYKIVSSANRTILMSFFPNFVSFISVFYFIVLVKTWNTMTNKSGDHCPFPDSRENALRFCHWVKLPTEAGQRKFIVYCCIFVVYCLYYMNYVVSILHIVRTFCHESIACPF